MMSVIFDSSQILQEVNFLVEAAQAGSGAGSVFVMREVQELNGGAGRNFREARSVAIGRKFYPHLLAHPEGPAG